MEQEGLQVELRSRARQQAAVAELGQFALATSQLDLLFGRAVRLVAQTLGVEMCKLLELLPGQSALLLRSGVGWQPGLVGSATVGAGLESQAGLTLARREPIVVEDLRTETRFTGPRLLWDHHVVSGMSVVVEGFGVLGAHTTHRRYFSADDVHFLTAVANVLAAAVGRNRVEEARAALVRRERAARRDLEGALRALRHTEARFRRLASSNIIGVIQADLDGRVLEANDAFLDMLGYTREDLHQGRIRWDASTPPEYREQDERRRQQLLTTGSTPPGEKELRRKDGSRVPVLIGSALQEHSRTEVVAFVLDLSERRHAEDVQRFLLRASAVLASSLEYETNLAEVARLAIPIVADWCLIDVADEHGQVHRLAEAAQDPAKDRLLRESRSGYPLPRDHGSLVAQLVRTGETIFRRYADAITPEEAQAVLGVPPWYLTALAPRSALAVPIRTRERTIGVMVFGLSESGRRYSEADRDVAEELARRCGMAVDNALLYREAQRAILARDDFLSIAAHELKTPITGLRGFAQLLRRRIDAGRPVEPEAVRQAVTNIDRQAAKLATLSSQLLDLTRIQAGKLVLEPRWTDLAQVVRDVVDTTRAQFDQPGLRLETPPELWGHVDPLRYEQVVTNLVDNAVKYGREGGIVEVVLDQPDAREIRLVVTDHGAGIPVSRLPHLFERFYQAEARDHAAGMGLGLYISRQIVELHGGRIAVDTPDQHGTRVTVSVPTGAPVEAGSTTAR